MKKIKAFLSLITVAALLMTAAPFAYSAETVNEYSNSDTECEAAGAYYFLDEDISPTVDAVPVVRCKDCKHGRLYRPNCVDCEFNELAKDADWFCADGERRTNDA